MVKRSPRVKAYQATEVDGIRFASKREARRYSELKLMERAKIISGLKLQERIPLYGQYGPILTPTGRHMKYVADFQYFDGDQIVIEDAKGWKTDTYVLKKAILLAMGITIREV